jgi:hypothetical protein
MTPRGLLTTIGATALGFGLIIGGAPVIPDVFAQEATPPAVEAPTSIREELKAEFEAQRAEAYDSFVAALASELGSEETAVDAAIRTALTQQVDEREAAGEIDLERAAAIRAVIEVSQAPLFLGFGGPAGMHSFHGHAGPHGPGDRIGGEDRDQDRDLPGEDEATADLPGENDAANQSAPAPVTPAESVAIS